MFFKIRPSEEAKTVCAVAAVFWLTLLTFSPLNMFIINRSEFSLSIVEVILFSLVPVLLLTACLGLMLLRLKAAAFRVAVALLTAFLLLIWFHGNILAWQYGILDGGPIDWGRYWVFGLVDVFLWVMALVYAVIRTPFLYGGARAVAGFLLFMQTTFLLVSLVWSPSSMANPALSVPGDASKFDFSMHRNVIVLVLDEFQSDIFSEIIAQHKEYKEFFDGFTYFPDALAPSTFTRVSIPAILTGQLYDNSEPKGTFFTKAFLLASIPKVLHEQGFQVDLFPRVESTEGNLEVYSDKRISDNFVIQEILNEKKIVDELRLLDLSLLRSVPFFLKQYIYNNDLWFLSRLLPRACKIFEPRLTSVKKARERTEDEVFIDAASSKAQRRVEKKMFKFFHLSGMHAPLFMNENLEVDRGIKYSRGAYARQAMAVLKLCQRFLGVLKTIGAYDESLIFVVGDHGSGRAVDMYFDYKFDTHNSRLNELSPEHNIFMDRSRGRPLVLVKRFKARGELRTSNAPVSLADIPQTVMAELGINAHMPGVSMFEVEVGSSRKRYCAAFQWTINQFDFENPITRYVVTGPVWDSRSWDVDAILYPAFFNRKR